jgi:hypothetical protein
MLFVISIEVPPTKRSTDKGNKKKNMHSSPHILHGTLNTRNQHKISVSDHTREYHLCYDNNYLNNVNYNNKTNTEL